MWITLPQSPSQWHRRIWSLTWPILLTSVTTFVGLVPLMSSDTPATRFFIPMAISLAFGVLFATAITLIMVPALYKVAEDISGWDSVAQGVHEHALDVPPETP